MLRIIFFFSVILILFYIGNIFYFKSRFDCSLTNQSLGIIFENFQYYYKDQNSRLNFLNIEPKIINNTQIINSHNSELKISCQSNCQSKFFYQTFINNFNKIQRYLEVKINDNKNPTNQLTIVQEDNILYNNHLKNKSNFETSITISNLWFIISLNKIYFLFITNIPNINYISNIKKLSKIGVLNNYDLVRLQKINNILDIELHIIKYKNRKDMLKDFKNKNIRFIFITLPFYDIEKLLNKNPEFFPVSIEKKYHSVINYIFKVIIFDKKTINTPKIIHLNTCYLKEILVINNITYYNKINLFLMLLVKNLKKINYSSQFKFIDILNEAYLSFCSPYLYYHPAARNFWIKRGRVFLQ